MILKIALGLFGLGIVVFIHELGHFIAARLCGIDVEAFSIGWGKPFLKKKVGDVEYRLGMFPIGGYCKMRGDADYEEYWNNKNNGIEPAKGSYFAAKPWKRIITAFAGPLFNFIFAVLVLSVVWGIGREIVTLENKIVLLSDIDGQSYPADQGGLLSGDRIIKINGKDTNYYRDILDAIAPNPKSDLHFTILRNNIQHELTIQPKLEKEGVGRIGVYPWIEPLITSVQPDSPAQKAGLQPGDRLLAVYMRNNDYPSLDNPLSEDLSGSELPSEDIPHDEIQLESDIIDLPREELPYTQAFLRIFEGRETADFLLEFERNGIIETAELNNVSVFSGFPDLGIEFPSIYFKTPALWPHIALFTGAKHAAKTFVLSLKSLPLLFNKEIDHSKAVSGPIRITYMVGEIAADGFERNIGAGLLSFFSFLSLISIALCLMNLLPLPIIDGGMIILYLVETVKRKPIHPRAISIYQMAGMVIIGGLIVFAAFNDILFFTNR